MRTGAVIIAAGHKSTISRFQPMLPIGDSTVIPVSYTHLTQIIKGVTKDAVFRKGHVVNREDIPVLLSVGKDQLYVWEKEEGMLHENDAAEILCDMCRCV